MEIKINPIYNFINDDNKRLNIIQTPFEEFLSYKPIEEEVDKDDFFNLYLPKLKEFLSNISINNENDLIMALTKFFRESEFSSIINLPIKYDDMYILYTYKNINGEISTNISNYSQNSICQTYKYMMNARCAMFELGLGIWDEVNTKVYVNSSNVRFDKTLEIYNYIHQFGRLPLNSIHIFIDILQYDKPLVKDIRLVDYDFLINKIFINEKQVFEYDSPIALMYYNKFSFEPLLADPNAEIVSIEMDQPLFIGTKSKIKIKANGRIIDIGLPDKDLFIWSNITPVKSKGLNKCNMCTDITNIIHYNLENSIPLVTYETYNLEESIISIIINGESMKNKNICSQTLYKLY